MLPILTELNPRVDQAIVRLASLAAVDAAFLGERAEALLEAATVERGRRAWRLEAKALTEAPSARELARIAAGSSHLVAPVELPSLPPAFSVAGCNGYELARAGRRSGTREAEAA